MDKTIFIENIPNTLKSRPQWVVWRLEPRGDNAKPSKVPYDAKTGYRAKTTDSATWCDFETVKRVYENAGQYNGIGYVFQDGDQIFGIDVDHCINDSTTENYAAAQEILAQFDSTYVEYSPSGDGLHIFGFGSPIRAGKGNTSKYVELYSHARYFTVTGRVFNANTELTDCQTKLEWLHSRFFNGSVIELPMPAPAPTVTESLDTESSDIDYEAFAEIHAAAMQPPADETSDDGCTPQSIKEIDYNGSEKPAVETSDDGCTPPHQESEINSNQADLGLDITAVLGLLGRAKNSEKFKTLMSGGGQQDESAGDFDLCIMIAFYSQDTAVIDAIFRQSKRANLSNGKWDRKDGDSTYGLKTIANAISKLTTKYTGKKANEPTPAAVHKNSGAKDWQKQLIVDTVKSGNFYTLELRGGCAAFYNMCAIMGHHPDLVGTLKFNEFSLRSTATPSENSGLPTGEVDDNFISEMRLFLTRCLCELKSDEVNWGAQDTYAAIVRTAKKNSYHPVGDYSNLLVWDGILRIDDFFSDFCGSEKSDYTIFVANSFFISAVARVMNPGCKVDTMVILEGTQGIGKSSLFAALCPDPAWFKDSGLAIGSKDAYTGLIGKWIVEMSELDSMNRTEITAVKAFLTSQVDSYRPPYEKSDQNIPRQCVFVGSTNKETYLKDETGARRFLPVRCTGKIDIDGVKAVRDQLWAEAVMLYKSGMKWWADNDELVALIQNEQAQRYDADPWEVVIEKWAKGQIMPFTTYDVAKDALLIGVKDFDKRVEMRITKTLTVLGYTKERRSIDGVRKVVWIKPTTQENDAPAF